MSREVEVQEATCHSCEKRPIRTTGLYVSRLEAWTDQRLYCDECADACAAGLWETDPDE